MSVSHKIVSKLKHEGQKGSNDQGWVEGCIKVGWRCWQGGACWTGWGQRQRWQAGQRPVHSVQVRRQEKQVEEATGRCCNPSTSTLSSPLPLFTLPPTPLAPAYPLYLPPQPLLWCAIRECTGNQTCYSHLLVHKWGQLQNDYYLIFNHDWKNIYGIYYSLPYLCFPPMVNGTRTLLWACRLVIGLT